MHHQLDSIYFFWLELVVVQTMLISNRFQCTKLLSRVYVLCRLLFRTSEVHDLAGEEGEELEGYRRSPMTP